MHTRTLSRLAMQEHQETIFVARTTVSRRFSPSLAAKHATDPGNIHKKAGLATLSLRYSLFVQGFVAETLPTDTTYFCPINYPQNHTSMTCCTPPTMVTAL